MDALKNMFDDLGGNWIGELENLLSFIRTTPKYSTVKHLSTSCTVLRL